MSKRQNQQPDQKQTVIVVFRKFRQGEDIIALFPEEPGSTFKDHCLSYQQTGQHSGADYDGCISASKPAKPEEYEPLKKELERIGYSLIIQEKATAINHIKRRRK